MKVRMNHDCEFGWYECDGGWEPIELPDAIIIEWRGLKARLEEIEKYFDERIPPLQREADAKVPPKPMSPVVEHWAKMMLKQYMTDNAVWKLWETPGSFINIEDIKPKKDAAD